MYLLYKILVIILIISFITGIIDIIYEHKHHLKKESSSQNLPVEDKPIKRVILDDEEII